MSKKQYICQNCGGIQSKWMGKCPDCNEWNTFQEEIVSDGKNKMSQSTKKRSLDSFEIAHPGSSAVQDFARTPTGIGEFDRVLGGGIVAGSFVLLGGDPGVGKSTLMLQVAQTFANTGKQVLYISGEESLQQIQLRAQRLDIVSNNISIVAENKLEDIIALGTAHTADMIIVDSIQTIYSIEVSSFPGSVTQVRTCAQNLMQFAKQSGKPVFTIGHVTKEGNLAGPKLLEHLVDTVLYLEGERYENFRVLRGVKNRFGSTSEVGIFAME
ncbi:MAG: DNA repair protein RadA [Patescibacteria group bacterium]|nr:DNA repair protein RadA [Patescibacteria group bacterium]